MTSGAEIIHQVPYYSQWESPGLVRAILSKEVDAADDPLWASSGAATQDEYAFWSWRLCGMACLRMALDFWWGVAPPSVTLAGECVEAGAYVRHGDKLDGLIHAPFAAYARERWGLEAQARPELAVQELAGLLAEGRLPMISVHPSVRELGPTPERPGGHLVLAVGATEDGLVIHNPSGFDGESQQFARVPWRDLPRFYAGRGVVLGAPQGLADAG
ncbi:C39 family peptidase [Kitasatospora sp. NPDC050543]|uniref:C39 family peptidase n=1 Tax=Kitasatospora sp. NPDC050543 TaxID=3364054 RepID=UPI00378E69FD